MFMMTYLSMFLCCDGSRSCLKIKAGIITMRLHPEDCLLRANDSKKAPRGRGVEGFSTKK